MTEHEFDVANEMRIAFSVQIDELIDVLTSCQGHMEFHGYLDEAARIRGAIAYARKVTKPYSYNGPYKPVYLDESGL